MIFSNQVFLFKILSLTWIITAAGLVSNAYSDRGCAEKAGDIKGRVERIRGQLGNISQSQKGADARRGKASGYYVRLDQQWKSLKALKAEDPQCDQKMAEINETLHQSEELLASPSQKPAGPCINQTYKDELNRRLTSLKNVLGTVSIPEAKQEGQELAEDLERGINTLSNAKEKTADCEETAKQVAEMIGHSDRFVADFGECKVDPRRRGPRGGRCGPRPECRPGPDGKPGPECARFGGRRGHHRHHWGPGPDRRPPECRPGGPGGRRCGPPPEGFRPWRH